MSIQANIAEYQIALKAVTDHCMCAEMIDASGKITIIYPAGDFATHGVRVDRSAHGLRQALAVMERHWVESYP